MRTTTFKTILKIQNCENMINVSKLKQRNAVGNKKQETKLKSQFQKDDIAT